MQQHLPFSSENEKLATENSVAEPELGTADGEPTIEKLTAAN
jgi:hypothetical protein